MSQTEPQPEVATKAPESDVASRSMFPNDSPAQQGSTMGDHCVTDRPSPSGASPKGEISKIAEIDVYITKPNDYPHSPSKLLLLLSSGTGIYSTNNQLQADHYATEGFLVVMPDQFGGDHAPNSATIDTAEEQPSMIEQFKQWTAEFAAATFKSFMLDMWLARQTPEKVMPILQKVIAGAKEEFADAVANGGGVYAAGYCFGAKYVLLLSSELSDTVAHGEVSKDEEPGVVKKESIFKASAIAHGTMITQHDLEGITSPITMVCVENDQLFPDDIREAGKKHLEEKQIEHEIKVYPGVPHGFAVVGDYEDAKIKEEQKTAFEQMLAWLKAH